jgi:hypothetical protein
VHVMLSTMLFASLPTWVGGSCLTPNMRHIEATHLHSDNDLFSRYRLGYKPLG